MVDLTTGVQTQYGVKFEQVAEIVGPNVAVGRVTSIGQIDNGSDVLRFITARCEAFK